MCRRLRFRLVKFPQYSAKKLKLAMAEYEPLVAVEGRTRMDCGEETDQRVISVRLALTRFRLEEID